MGSSVSLCSKSDDTVEKARVATKSNDGKGSPTKRRCFTNNNATNLDDQQRPATPTIRSGSQGVTNEDPNDNDDQNFSTVLLPNVSPYLIHQLNINRSMPPTVTSPAAGASANPHNFSSSTTSLRLSAPMAGGAQNLSVASSSTHLQPLDSRTLTHARQKQQLYQQRMSESETREVPELKTPIESDEVATTLGPVSHPAPRVMRVRSPTTLSDVSAEVSQTNLHLNHQLPTQDSLLQQVMLQQHEIQMLKLQKQQLWQHNNFLLGGMMQQSLGGNEGLGIEGFRRTASQGTLNSNVLYQNGSAHESSSTAPSPLHHHHYFQTPHSNSLIHGVGGQAEMASNYVTPPPQLMTDNSTVQTPTLQNLSNLNNGQGSSGRGGASTTGLNPPSNSWYNSSLTNNPQSNNNINNNINHNLSMSGPIAGASFQIRPLQMSPPPPMSTNINTLGLQTPTRNFGNNSLTTLSTMASGSLVTGQSFNTRNLFGGLRHPVNTTTTPPLIPASIATGQGQSKNNSVLVSQLQPNQPLLNLNNVITPLTINADGASPYQMGGSPMGPPQGVCYPYLQNAQFPYPSETLGGGMDGSSSSHAGHNNSYLEGAYHPNNNSSYNHSSNSPIQPPQYPPGTAYHTVPIHHSLLSSKGVPILQQLGVQKRNSIPRSVANLSTNSAATPKFPSQLTLSNMAERSRENAPGSPAHHVITEINPERRESDTATILATTSTDVVAPYVTGVSSLKTLFASAGARSQGIQPLSVSPLHSATDADPPANLNLLDMIDAPLSSDGGLQRSNSVLTTNSATPTSGHRFASPIEMLKDEHREARVHRKLPIIPKALFDDDTLKQVPEIRNAVERAVAYNNAKIDGEFKPLSIVASDNRPAHKEVPAGAETPSGTENVASPTANECQEGNSLFGGQPNGDMADFLRMVAQFREAGVVGGEDDVESEG